MRFFGQPMVMAQKSGRYDLRDNPAANSRRTRPSRPRVSSRSRASACDLSWPLADWTHAQAPAVLDHSRTLPQDDGRAGPGDHTVARHLAGITGTNRCDDRSIARSTYAPHRNLWIGLHYIPDASGVPGPAPGTGA